jgi:hypothetical protein
MQKRVEQGDGEDCKMEDVDDSTNLEGSAI